MSEIKDYPAPWDLTGKGYIFIYKFKKDFVEQEGNVPEFLKGKFSGGFGSVMLVDYSNSNAGPYQELLFIPGKFKFKNKKLDTISKIFVSTEESVINGRKNWGIPKEKAEFKFEQISKNEEQITIEKNNKLIAKFTLKSHKLKFFVSTKLLPFPLVQEYENNYFYTNFYGKGKGVFSVLKNISINEEFFPNISKAKPIACIKVEPFNITFPKAEIQKK